MKVPTSPISLCLVTLLSGAALGQQSAPPQVLISDGGVQTVTIGPGAPPHTVGLKGYRHVMVMDTGARSYALRYAVALNPNDPRAAIPGDMWYRADVDLTAEQVKGKVHLLFPGLFNECRLYVNGTEVAFRQQGNIWWLNDYAFEWDADLSGKLRVGKNTLALRANCEHHLGGMFRRPFLYAPSAK